MTQHKTVVDRVKDLENAFPEVVSEINKHLDSRFGPVVQALNAIMDILGRETVAAKIEELRETQARQEMESKKAQLEALIAEGRLAKTDTVGEKSLIVGQEVTKDGKVVPPGRFQLHFGEIAPKFQEQLLGKTSGASFEIPDYGKFEVQEIYNFVTPAVPAAIVEPAPVSAPQPQP